jgi:hypothetical protein
MHGTVNNNTQSGWLRNAVREVYDYMNGRMFHKNRLPLLQNDAIDSPAAANDSLKKNKRRKHRMFLRRRRSFFIKQRLYTPYDL